MRFDSFPALAAHRRQEHASAVARIAGAMRPRTTTAPLIPQQRTRDARGRFIKASA